MTPPRAAAAFLIAAAALLPCTLAGAAPATDDQQQPFAADESLWTAFYDLPTRRFRGIKEAHLRQDRERVATDLVASAKYLRVEAERSMMASALVASANALEGAALDLDDTCTGRCEQPAGERSSPQ